MKPEIENLKVWMSGKSTTGYQRALAMRELEQLLTYVAKLYQLRQPPVIKSVCGDCLYYLTCNHESRDKQICNNYDNEP